MKLLFVCMGNICRSPAAEGIMKKHLENDQALADSVTVESAGTIGFHSGKPADERMRQAAASRGYHLDSIARQIQPEDFFEYDRIIAMDQENFYRLLLTENQLKESGDGDKIRARVQLLSDFLDDSWPTDVPDPYYGGADGFEYVLDMIEAACPTIRNDVRKSLSDPDPK